jgi:hypothetical protein
MSSKLINLETYDKYDIANFAPICIQVHSTFDYILSEIGQTCHGESAQPLNKWGGIAMNK